MKTIPLSQGMFTTVDDEDYSYLNAFKWCIHKVGRRTYAARNVRCLDGKIRTIHMHQPIFGYPALLRGRNHQVDHDNGNGLDNRRGNLKECDHEINQQGFQRKRVGTTSRFRGVSWNKKGHKWVARVDSSLGRTYVGLFDCEEAAARARDIVALEQFGPHAQLNFSL